MEIVQPDIRMLPSNDPEAWEMTPVIYGQWAQVVMPQLGYDTEQVSLFLLGSAIERILDDDGNVFNILNLGDLYDLVADATQKQILTRLTWETSLGVLPDDIQNTLIAIHRLIKGQDWSDWDQIVAAYRSWGALRNTVEGRFCPESDLGVAYEHFQNIKEALNVYWMEFLKLNIE
jgi:hypothetical protein